MAIFVTLAVSYNLVVGVAGQLHLGPNAFITIGAYTAALLTLRPAEKEIIFLMQPLMWPLNQISLPFLPALLAGGLVAAGFGVLTGFPVFRVRGDYLAIVTLGFGEVVRVLANNLQGLTNGSLGLKGLMPYTSLWWAWGVAVVTVAAVQALKISGYGRALAAIRQDETAAKAMGVNTFRHLLLAYVLSAFFFGLGGGLLAHLITTISHSVHLFPDLQPAHYHCGGGTRVHHRGRAVGLAVHRGGGVAQICGRAPGGPGSAHPRHSRHAPGDLFSGPAFGDYFLSPGLGGAPGVFLGRPEPGRQPDFSWASAAF